MLYKILNWEVFKRMSLYEYNLHNFKEILYAKFLSIFNLFKHKTDEEIPNDYLKQLLKDVRENKNLEEGSIKELFKEYLEKH
jgi:hypothetical protein